MRQANMHQKGFAALSVLGLVLIVGIVGFAGFRVLQVGQSTKVPITVPTPKTTPSNSPKKEEDPFIKQYENAALGLSFTYPSAWTVTNAGRVENYSFRLVSTGEPVTYNTNSNKWFKKTDKKNEYSAPIVKSSPNYKVFDFKDGANTADPDCREQNYVIIARGQAVTVFIPKACPAEKTKSGEYTVAQRDKDIENFFASIKDL